MEDLRAENKVLRDRLEQIALYEECVDDDYIAIYGDPGGMTQGQMARLTLQEEDHAEAK